MRAFTFLVFVWFCHARGRFDGCRKTQNVAVVLFFLLTFPMSSAERMRRLFMYLSVYIPAVSLSLGALETLEGI